MKVSNILSIFAVTIASTSALAIDIQQFSKDQSPVVTPFDQAIPGNSPVTLCSKDPSTDLVTIDHVDIDPNPPVPGETLNIQASGTVKQRIEEGAYIWVEVKIGYIILIRKTFDFCEEIKNVDMECPIEEGPLTVSKDVELPAQIPKGKFVVTAKVFNKDDDPITCLKAEVDFRK